MTAQDDPRRAYFDSIAAAWDGWHDLQAEQDRLAAGLREFALGPAETVLDVGCGTGNLTRALLPLLPEGRVWALDLAPRMLAIAQQKIADPRVGWLHGCATNIPLDPDCCDRVICYSVWPHLRDPRAAATELGRVLRRGGRLHIWHLASRHTINAIHAGAGEAVWEDLLVPAPELATLLEDLGWSILACIDDEDRYLVSAEAR